MQIQCINSKTQHNLLVEIIKDSFFQQVVEHRLCIQLSDFMNIFTYKG